MTPQIEKAQNDAGEAMIQEVSHFNWKDKTGRRNGAYNKGWRFSREGDKIIVYNETDYQLTHLLEKGHVIVRNKEAIGLSPAIPHINPAFKKTKKGYFADLKKIKIEPKG